MAETTYPNYSTQFLSAPIKREFNPDNQIRAQKNDEKEQMAPKITPFTLDASKQMLGDMYVKLAAFRSMVKKTENLPDSNPNSFIELYKLIDDIGEKILIDIPREVDKVLI